MVIKLGDIYIIGQKMIFFGPHPDFVSIVWFQNWTKILELKNFLSTGWLFKLQGQIGQDLCPARIWSNIWPDLTYFDGYR